MDSHVLRLLQVTHLHSSNEFRLNDSLLVYIVSGIVHTGGTCIVSYRIEILPKVVSRSVVSSVQADGNCLCFIVYGVFGVCGGNTGWLLCAVVTLIIENGGRSVEWVNVSQNNCRCFNQMVNSRPKGNF
jgi:hypothetical protein